MTANDQTIRNVRSLSLLASLLFIAIICTQADQSIERPPEGEYQRLRGQNLVIPCVVRNRIGECFWLKNGEAIGPITNKYSFERTPQNGDCSIHIKQLTPRDDEGNWQCQVTRASLDSSPISSGISRVVVLVTPNPPLLQGLTNGNLRVQADRPHEVECVSTGGNPATRIEWFINGQNVTENSKTNVDKDTSSTPRVTSILNHTFKRSHRNATITCLSVHPVVTQNTSATLDVLYAPQVTVPQKVYTVTEGAHLEVPCIVDANPPLSPTWRSADGIADFSDFSSERGGLLKLHSITKKLNGARFECRAANDYGQSQEQITLDVLFEPTLTDSTKAEQSVELGNSIELYCNYQGNPQPKIMWFHINPITDQVTTRESDPESPGRLRLTNVTYHDEGHYYCELLNHNPITNTDKIVRSARMVVDVFGRPAVVQKPEYASGYRGTATDIEQIFCSDPPPTTVYWTYGSLRIDVPQKATPFVMPSNNGNQNLTKAQRHKAQPLIALERHQSQVKCFRSILTIANTDMNDEREYTLVVENPKGMTESVIALKVKSPISAAIMITIGLIVLIMLLALTLVTTLVIKRRKLAKEKADDESKAEARAPMNSDTDKPEKEPEKNKGENHELVYANLDFAAKPEPKPAKGKPQAQQRRTNAANGSGSATEYAQIQFANKADL